MCRRLLNISVKFVFDATFDLRDRLGIVTATEYVGRMVNEDKKHKPHNADDLCELLKAATRKNNAD